jgi:hypothetical protein
VPAAPDRENGSAVILFHQADMGIEKAITSPTRHAIRRPPQPPQPRSSMRAT